MNGIDNITARIEADALAEAAKITEDAEKRGAELLAEAENEAQAAYWQRAKEGMQSMNDRVARLGGAADMEARKSILNYKAEAVESVFEAAKKKLLALPEEEYIAFLAGQAAMAAETGRESLVFSARDAKLAPAVAEKANALLAEQGKPAELSVSDDTLDCAGGLTVCAGSVSVNCTIDALVENARQTMTAEIAAYLFN